MPRMTNSVPMQWRTSPTLVRVVPFLLFVGLTALQGQWSEASRYWIYVLKTFIGVGLIWMTWPWISEMRCRFSLDAVVVGIAVFALWVGLDGCYPPLDTLIKRLVSPVAAPLGLANWCAAPAAPPRPWNPHYQFGAPVAWTIA